MRKKKIQAQFLFYNQQIQDSPCKTGVHVSKVRLLMFILFCCGKETSQLPGCAVNITLDKPVGVS